MLIARFGRYSFSFVMQEILPETSAILVQGLHGHLPHWRTAQVSRTENKKSVFFRAIRVQKIFFFMAIPDRIIRSKIERAFYFSRSIKL